MKKKINLFDDVFKTYADDVKHAFSEGFFCGLKNSFTQNDLDDHELIVETIDDEFEISSSKEILERLELNSNPFHFSKD